MSLELLAWPDKYIAYSWSEASYTEDYFVVVFFVAEGIGDRERVASVSFG